MMKLIVVSRLVLVGALIFAVLIGTVPSVATNESSNSSSARRESDARAPLSVLVATGVNFLGHYLTPIPRWQAEIRRLAADERFVQQWMLLNEDSASLQKGRRAIERIQKQKEAVEKKLNRFRKWYYPVSILVGAGAMMLTWWLQGE